jgi:hypothetical protein
MDQGITTNRTNSEEARLNRNQGNKLEPGKPTRPHPVPLLPLTAQGTAELHVPFVAAQHVPGSGSSGRSLRAWQLPHIHKENKQIRRQHK